MTPDQKILLFGIFRMITRKNGELAHYDDMERFFDITNKLIKFSNAEDSSKIIL
jgi:hypothetical protein